MSKRKKSRFFKWTKRAFFAGLLFHISTQASYFINDYYNYKNPSSIRKEFNEIAGFPIKGWSTGIEDLSYEKINTLSDIIIREKIERDFELVNLRIESNNYLKRDVIEQPIGVISSGYLGWCWMNRIGLKEESNMEVAVHEIKHKKSFDILKTNPEFFYQWMDFSRDNNGNSLYLYKDFGKWVCKRVRYLEHFVEEDLDHPDNLEKGFISGYARTNIYEDMAELCATVEHNSEMFQTLLFDERNERIAGKIGLAREYGLIPFEFEEYLKLKRLHEKDKKGFYDKSTAFLDHNKESVYSGEIYMLRGNLEYRDLSKAIGEYKQVLNLNYKKKDDYLKALKTIGECYTLLKDKRSKIFQEAYKEYENRFKNKDLYLPVRGVNDFLKEKGIIVK